MADDAGINRRSFLLSAGALGASALVGAGAASSLLAGCGSGSTSGSAASPATLAELGERLAGRLVLPGDPEYPMAKLIYNLRYQGVDPAAIAYCASPDDVVTTLRFARDHNLRFRSRAGGHCFTGLSTTEGGIVIDVGEMNTITTDGDTAEIGAGARLFDVYATLWEEQRAIPAGSCPSVGATGLTLGGGLGPLGRLHGTTSDSLEAIQAVTADGRIVEASADENEDLFWASRGGSGGNFAIVTSLRFRTSEVGANSMFELVFPWSAAATVFATWQELAPTTADGLYMVCKLGATAPRPGARKQLSCSVSGEYQGPKAELVDLIDPLLEAGGTPTSRSVTEGTFIDGRLFWGRCRGYSDDECHIRGREPGQRPEGLIGREAYARYAQFFDDPIGADGFAVAARWIEGRADDREAGDGLLFAEPLGGAFNRVEADATAFVHRSSLYWAEIEAKWEPDADQDRVDRDVAWVRGFLDDLRPFSSGAVYQNFPDAELDNWLEAAYGSNLPRLQDVKRRWDPDHVFAFPGSIPPR